MKNIIDKLNNLYQRSKDHPDQSIDRPLYKLLCSRDLLRLAYENIKSKPGSITPGVTPETLDGISDEALEQISQKLEDESFQFSTARRVQIPKCYDDGRTRPITVAPPRDKLVQEGIRLILNSIYEPLFVNESHGFRPNRGCHSALKQVNQKMQSAV